MHGYGNIANVYISLEYDAQSLCRIGASAALDNVPVRPLMHKHRGLFASTPVVWVLYMNDVDVNVFSRW